MAQISHLMKRSLLFNLFLPRCKKGSFLSRIFRIVFENKQIKNALGFALVFLMIFCGTLSPVFGSSIDTETREEILVSPKPIISTQTTFQRPVEGEISQTYHWYHPAVDIARNEGKEVNPVADGQVVEIGFKFFGYGKYIVIKHGEEATSLYAHLDDINVQPEQEVDKETVLGWVGSTGRSTGAHLHLEIEIEGERINPVFVIEDL